MIASSSCVKIIVKQKMKLKLLTISKKKTALFNESAGYNIFYE
jgi:hypothetical protein